MTPLPLLFIAGLGRSGSTLLGRLLGSVPGLVSVGELTHLWERGLRDHERCSCGEPFDACPFWTEVGERAFGGWHNIDVEKVLSARAAIERDRFIPMLAVPALSRGRLDEYGRYLVPLYEAVRVTAGADVVVDSGKHVAAAMVLQRLDGIDLSMVHLVHDSRGVAYSWTKQMARPERTDGEFMARWSPPHTAIRYLAYNLALHAIADKKSLLVRYEDLVRQPDLEMARILELVNKLNVSADAWSGGAVELGLDHQIGGNPMRFSSGRIPLVVDDAWRDRLPVKSRRVVTALTMPLLSGYDYLGKRSA